MKRDGGRKQRPLSQKTSQLVAVFCIVALVLASIHLSLHLSWNFWSEETAALSYFPPLSRNQQNAPPDNRNNKNHVAACLLIMDDNHWLIEWLAYHYTTMNLRQLIIAIDGRSQTSPLPILDRWQGRIAFELWNDTHYFTPPPPALAAAPASSAATTAQDLQQINLARQQAFLAKCLQTWKLRAKTSWVMTTDTDEFIVINPRTRQSGHALYRTRVPSLEQPGAILSFLNAEQKRNQSLQCLAIGRLQFSPDEDESSNKQVQRHGMVLPATLNASDFLTLRWLRPATDLVGPKNIIDLSTVDAQLVLRQSAVYQHRVLTEICPEAGFTWTRENSLLQLHHYFGTFEQFHFRHDARWTLPDAGRNTRYERFRGRGTLDTAQADAVQLWLSAFVKLVGEKQAQSLLQNVGQVQGWPGPQAHQDRFAVAS